MSRKWFLAGMAGTGLLAASLFIALSACLRNTNHCILTIGDNESGGPRLTTAVRRFFC